MRNAVLDETQAGIKIAGRNNNNLRCADDTTLMAQSKEELKSLLMNVNEESEKLASGSITSWQIGGGENGNSDRVYFFALQNHCRWGLQS